MIIFYIVNATLTSILEASFYIINHQNQYGSGSQYVARRCDFCVARDFNIFNPSRLKTFT